jgi:hypothetical protein
MTRARGTVLVGLVVIGAIVGMCAVRNGAWNRQAEAAIEHAAELAGPGVTDSEFVTLIPEQDLATKLAEPRTIEVLAADNFLGGTTLADILSPGVLVAEIRSQYGQELHAEARRGQGHVWRVSLRREERQR